MTYPEFLARKAQLAGQFGFNPIWMPDGLFDFQAAMCDWSIQKGRAALLEDCGMGKTRQQLVFAENVIRKTNRPVLVLTPIAVGHQTVAEADKIGVASIRSGDGRIPAAPQVIVANYERLHHFNPHDFAGVVCDESSILKNFDGATKAAVIEFMRTIPYRLLCTATAAPNDYIELGNSSEALGELGFMDMVARFFKKVQKASSRKDENRSGMYRFRGHAEKDFWRWICSWARALRKPSDLGFSNDGFILPKLIEREHIVSATTLAEGMLLPLPAHTLSEQREERRRTLKERCEKAAEIAMPYDSCISWCQLNDEGNLLEKLIPDSVQITGDDSKNQSEEEQEEFVKAFVSGQVKHLIAKQKTIGFGMNFQHCAHQTHFATHSFEQYYQSVRRSWRFGQKQDVTIDVIASEGETRVLSNLQRKARAAEEMFAQLVKLMGDELGVKKKVYKTKPTKLPKWIQ